MKTKLKELMSRLFAASDTVPAAPSIVPAAPSLRGRGTGRGARRAPYGSSRGYGALLAIVLCAVGLAAQAADVARIVETDVGYPSISAACDAVGNNQTIGLLADAPVTADVNLTGKTGVSVKCAYEGFVYCLIESGSPDFATSNFLGDSKVRATATGPISLKATFTPGAMKFFRVGVSDRW